MYFAKKWLGWLTTELQVCMHQYKKYAFRCSIFCSNVAKTCLCKFTPGPPLHSINSLGHIQLASDVLKPQTFTHWLIVNKSCKVECCVNKMLQIFQNMFSQGLELELSMFRYRASTAPYFSYFSLLFWVFLLFPTFLTKSLLFTTLSLPFWLMVKKYIHVLI